MKKADGIYPKEVFMMDNDREINDCLIKLSLRLTCNNNNPHLKMYEEQFIRAYKKLSDNKKEIVKKDFIKILNRINKLNEKGEMKL